MLELLKSIFWSMPGLSVKEKEKIFFKFRKIIKQDNQIIDRNHMEEVLLSYRNQVLNIPTMRAKGY